MARQASVLSLSAGTGAYNVTQAASFAAGAVVTLTTGTYQMLEINCDQDVMVTVGLSTTIATPSATNGKRIPANQQTTIDLGASFDTIKVFNLGTANGTGGQIGSTAANLYITKLTVV